MPTTHNQCSPAMKNRIAQTIEISMVWPKSGWRTSGPMVKGNNASAMMLPGTPLRAAPSEKAQATSTTKAGFRNSDGCTPKIQRRAPLTSWPKNSVANDQRHAIG